MQADQHFKELLDKYLAGTCNPQEKAIMEAWFERGGNISKADMEMNGSNRMQLLTRIHDMQDKQSLPVHSTRKSTLRTLFAGWRAAAVWGGILITAGVAAWQAGIIRSLNGNHETMVAYRLIQTGKGEVNKFVLPDGSEVMLNANSRLEYHPDFAQHRQLRLFGEALFAVAHDKAHPFTVHTGDSLATTVLGTRFNIRSYDKGQETRVTVESGIVAVNKGHQSLDTLTKGEAIRYQKASRSFAITHDVHTESVTGWTKGEWAYENLRYIDLAILLQNHYGITLNSHRNIDLLQTGVSVNFNNKQSFKDILSVFCSFAGCSFRATSPTTIELY